MSLKTIMYNLHLVEGRCMKRIYNENMICYLILVSNGPPVRRIIDKFYNL